MKNHNSTVKKITRAVESIDEAIAQGKQEVFAVTTVEQLEKFKMCLLQALNLISMDDVPEKKNKRELGMARVVVDQWPFDLELGLLIVEAEQAYKSL